MLIDFGATLGKQLDNLDVNYAPSMVHSDSCAGSVAGDSSTDIDTISNWDEDMWFADPGVLALPLSTAVSPSIGS